MNYLNISINGQASNEFKLKNAEERLYGITSKAKCIYSYRPPKVIFDGNIIWSILGFIIIKEFTLNKELFCC